MRPIQTSSGTTTPQRFSERAVRTPHYGGGLHHSQPQATIENLAGDQGGTKYFPDILERPATRSSRPGTGRPRTSYSKPGTPKRPMTSTGQVRVGTPTQVRVSTPTQRVSTPGPRTPMSPGEDPDTLFRDRVPTPYMSGGRLGTSRPPGLCTSSWQQSPPDVWRETDERTSPMHSPLRHPRNLSPYLDMTDPAWQLDLTQQWWTTPVKHGPSRLAVVDGGFLATRPLAPDTPQSALFVSEDPTPEPNLTETCPSDDDKLVSEVWQLEDPSDDEAFLRLNANPGSELHKTISDRPIPNMMMTEVMRGFDHHKSWKMLALNERQLSLARQNGVTAVDKTINDLIASKTARRSKSRSGVTSMSLTTTRPAWYLADLESHGKMPAKSLSQELLAWHEPDNTCKVGYDNGKKKDEVSIYVEAMIRQGRHVFVPGDAVTRGQ